jgi:Niemann-Pick C1 protein
MYDICGHRSDGKVLNCPYASPSIQPDELFSAKIQSLCPTISGNVCCTETQFDTLRSQVQQAVPFLVGCPACLRNFLNLFCELSCSPNQSLFINVTSVAEVSGNLTVDGIDYHITDTFGEGLYESCKEVKFGTMNTRAINFVGGGAKNFRGALQFCSKAFHTRFILFQKFHVSSLLLLFQNGLRLLVRKHHLAFLVHHMRSTSNQASLSHLRWYQ